MIEKRIKKLNKIDFKKGNYVIYWMQASQRIEYNHALKLAINEANLQNLPLIIIFCLVTNYPSANYRHYKFMIEGLKELSVKLGKMGLLFYTVKTDSPSYLISKISQNASLVITDRGYTKIQKKWRSDLLRLLSCPFYQVESDVIVPVEIASSKEEFSAATLRKKIWREAKYFLLEEKFYLPSINNKSLNIKFMESLSGLIDLNYNVDRILTSLKIDSSVPSASFRGGYSEARKILKDFIDNKLPYYAKFARDPSKNFLSNLSPYLHFGQISPLEIAQTVLNSNSPSNEFIEELLVRRELAINFVNYNNGYDNYSSSVPDWAQKTLSAHLKDKRTYIYSIQDLESAKTHDQYWNAAQKEMLKTGKMHSYMRMYWGKKLIEWTDNPKDAYDILLYLNDKYELDGRDPNGYAGIAWCFGKHDHPWPDREIFGKVRYMNSAGLERKFNMKKYIEQFSLNEVL